jgi:hypothetical protein
MRLLSEPKRPHVSHYYVFYPYLNSRHGWRKFVPGWDEELAGFS